VEKGTPGSIIFWGPPGSGKTTLAHLIAASTGRVFVPFSAVTEGVPRIREIVNDARARLAAGGKHTILFIDEIHRLNKAQQDSLLPPAEDGTVTLIGATTENPSFEINGALLSRTRVFVLQPLAADDIEGLLRRALADEERGLGAQRLILDDEALQSTAVEAEGDARRALTVLEAAAAHVGEGGRITVEVAREAMQKRFARYDKAGEEHFNLLSAYHKSLRGSDPQGALYWMARMLDGGEDPMTLFRRAIAMAAEDIGLADPNALLIAVAARDAFHMLGPPEGYLPLAEMTIYLATAPKSNSAKVALGAALEAARETPAAPVPLHIRNAPTGLMKELGYGKGYRYAHDSPDAYLPQEYLPDELRGTRLYRPGTFGYEKRVAERLAWWEGRKAREGGVGGADGEDGESRERR
jgi:putative ATPase